MIVDRRIALALLGSALAAPAFAQGAGMSRVKAYAFSFKGLHGEDIRLADFSGRPILIVNTASLCGYTPQYAGLQTLWTRYRDKGLMIVGVPSNDFGSQEPGGEAEIDHTLHRYNVAFPIATKVAVRGNAPHPFYRWAAIERPLDTPRWNFHKYLVGRDGQLAAAFPAAVEPTDARLISAIERELGAA
ncbi:MAG: glutathione peroxidase [Pseudorhodoplanes sp.]|nr:Hydroperoxy fatty acid reductase gpx1 [Pseudorhodoplanes sp.]MBW7948525.1 glutathione peroxidase [Pseudorhodoplanes sp.]MCL4711229.1 glutathione peroxidase [Pseudorhodoplanes sp.]GIK79005.1 MAG: glutathione peroxidase [Alphaproteobacteria bacterium]